MQNLIDGLRAVETARKALVLEGTKEEQLDLQIRVLSTALHYFIQAFGAIVTARKAAPEEKLGLEFQQLMVAMLRTLYQKAIGLRVVAMDLRDASDKRTGSGESDPDTTGVWTLFVHMNDFVDAVAKFAVEFGAISTMELMVDELWQDKQANGD